jgi:hypothetical protein
MDSQGVKRSIINRIDISQQLLNTIQDFLSLQFSLKKAKAHADEKYPCESLQLISDNEAFGTNPDETKRELYSLSELCLLPEIQSNL